MKIRFIITFILLGLLSYAQDDLLSEIDVNDEDSSAVNSVFKGLKIINFESTKMVTKGGFYFVVSHRFGSVQNGFKTLFGLDEAVTHLNFIYGLTDEINISDEVKAIGYPNSIFSVTEGKISNSIVSKPNEEFDLILLDCNIFPGNSGGPIMLSETEEVIGLAVAAGKGDFTGMNLGCKINLLKEKVKAEGIDIYK